MTRRWISPALLGLALFGTAALPGAARAAEHKTSNVIVVMTDGMRWQEVFNGADEAMLNKEHGGVSDVDNVRRKFWRETAQERRQALLPFLWTVVAKSGQIYGNRNQGSDAFVTNGFNFSYPGYSELLCGFADPRVDSNDKNPNLSASVLEWLQKKPAYAGRIAAFGAWDLFPFILNTSRSGLFVNAGYDPLKVPPVTPRIALLNRLKKETGIWGGEPLDAPAFLTALEHFKLHKPRILFVSLGDTDEWAHSGKYDLYLEAAHRFDAYVKELWTAAQSMPEYRGTTSLILAVDHGRGPAPDDWKSHGQKQPESKYVWMGFLGPDTPAMGERSKVPAVTESQIAATLAGLLGENYNAAVDKAGKPIADVLPR